MSISNSKFVRLAVAMLLFIATTLAFHSSCLAQDRDEKDRDDRDDRMDRELRREKYRRDFDLKSYLNKLDDNKSGVLEKGELKSDRTRRYLSDMGIDVSKSVPIDLAVRQAELTSAKKRDAEREKFENKVGPKLNSFGAEQSTLGLSSFGVDAEDSSEVASFDDRLSGLRQSDFDEKTLSDARKMLKGYDRDESGFLEGDEINRIRWKDPSPTESDLNGDGRISMLEMAQRIAIKSEESREKGSKGQDDNRKDGNRKDGNDRRDDNDKRGRDKESRGDDGGRGEGEGGRVRRDKGDKGGRSDRDRSRAFSKIPSSASKGTGSDRSGGSKTTTSKTTTTKSTTMTKSSSSKEKAYANYVDNVFKKYDIDKDKRLSPDELKKMKRPFRGDIDKDGFLTKEEAVNFIKGGTKNTKKTEKATAGKTPPRKPSGRNEGSGGRGMAAKLSGKATPAMLSSMLAGKRRSLSDLDTNSDGQIQMSEFSSTWDEETLQNFRKTDSNQDGILSPSEWDKRTN